MSEQPQSLHEPQLTPSEHCYTVLQDHGEDNGGWGPAAVLIPGLESMGPRPFVYTGESEVVLEGMARTCRKLAQTTGKPTRLVRFSEREDLAVFGGSS